MGWRTLFETLGDRAELGVHREAAWNRLAGPQLIDWLREAVANEQHEELLAAWNRARDPEIGNFIDYFYRVTSPYHVLSVDRGRLWGTLRGMVAGALGVLAARNRDATAIVEWSTEAARCFDDGEIPRDPPPVMWTHGVEPHALLDGYFTDLAAAGWRVGMARDFLGELIEHPRAVRRTRWMPVLGCLASKGFVCRLQVELVADGKGEFYPEPRQMAFLPMTGDFLASAECAWQAAQGELSKWNALAELSNQDVRWWLSTPPTVLNGNSLSAAMACALVQLLCDAPLDGQCAITAGITASGSLTGVGEVPEKVEAAIADGIAKVVVAAENETAAQVQATSRGRSENYIRSARTLSDACRESSGLAQAFSEYYQILIQGPDREQLPVYMQDRRLTELYVEPDVLKRVREAKFRVKDDEQQAERVSSRHEREPAEVRDIGERPYGHNEDKREERVAWHPQWQTALLHSQPWRAVIVGAPGQGKSLLLEMTARQLAEQGYQDLRDQRKPLDQLVLPVLVKLKGKKLERKSTEYPSGEKPKRDALQAAFREILQDDYGAEIGSYLADQLDASRTWLLLDGLDESDTSRLEWVFEVLRDWQCRVLITSRPHAYEGIRLPYAVEEYRLAPFSPGQVQQFLDKWFEDKAVAAGANELIRNSPALESISQVPFLLTLLSWVGERHEIASEMTRTELYDRILRDILGLPLEGSRTVDEQRAVAWLPLLAQVAWFFFQQHQARHPLETASLLDIMESNPKRPTLLGWTAERTAELSAREKAELLLGELQRKRLLVPYDASRSSYVAPHRSILEYLAGYALAQQLQGNWEADCSPVKLSVVPREQAWELVDKKAWHPDWEEVVCFASGILDDPMGLLEMLANPQPTATNPYGDDIFRHRLGLAGQCLGELRTPLSDDQVALVRHIADELLSVWLYWSRDELEAVVSHLTRSFHGIGRHREHLAGTNVMRHLLQQMADPDEGVRTTAIRAVGGLGAAAGSQLQSELAQRFKSAVSDTRQAAARAVGNLGAAANVKLQLRLARVLRDEDNRVRLAAAEAVGNLGTAASVKLQLRLIPLLRDVDSDIRWAAVRAIGRLGAAASAKLQLRLGPLLHDNDRNVRQAAAEAVGNLGTAASVKLQLRLIPLLRDVDSDIRWAAARAVGRLGAAVSAKLQLPLVSLLRDVDSDIRWAAARAIGRLGAAASAKLQLRLGPLLHDNDRNVRQAAAWAVGNLGAAVSAKLQSRLGRLLRDSDSNVRQAAARAVGNLGAAASAKLQSRLGPLLRDNDSNVRQAAARAVGNLGAAANVKLQLRLARVLRDEDNRVRLAAAEAVGYLGAAANVKLQLRLARVLRDEDKRIRFAATEAVGYLGAAANAKLQLRLIPLFRDVDFLVRQEAVLAVGSFGADANARLQSRLVQLLRDDDQMLGHTAATVVSDLMASGTRFLMQSKSSVQLPKSAVLLPFVSLDVLDVHLLGR